MLKSLAKNYNEERFGDPLCSMTTQKLRPISSFTLLLLDMLVMALAFYLAYELRARINFPGPLQTHIPFVRYLGLMAVWIGCVALSLFLYRQYYVTRAPSRVDQLYAIAAAVSIGTLVAVGVAALVFKNTPGSLFEIDFPRVMLIYAWLLAIILIMVVRILHQMSRSRLRRYGLGQDRLLVVGTGETARIIMQRIQWQPQLGYILVGVVTPNGSNGLPDIYGVPVLGQSEELTQLIEKHQIDEVIIAMPEKGHREVVRVISLCQRGRVSIKVFPDVFEFVTSEATIDDLGGLPLLTVRDYSMRGYGLMFKRVLDIIGSGVGLISLSPLLLLTAIAIKLESPGPVFFVQERMGLDGKVFPMIKFRSMRTDAERSGPGWTVKDDPRRTRLGTLLRRVDIDEMPQLINVLLGEMSLVGPRPEQPYYVDQFRQKVPRYMERHREKAGMTGWAQVNGLRGDTSIEERTRYDVWYTENWSLLLDIKILLRTVWQKLALRNQGG